MNPDNDELHLSPFDRKKVSGASVMVVGCGALGNEVIKNLALMRVGHLVLVDFDRVELPNLSCAVLFEREDALSGVFKVEAAGRSVKRLSPDTRVDTIIGDIAYDVGIGLMRQMDVIIGCVDSRWARYCINRLAMRASVPWVDGGIDSLEGTARVFAPGMNCYGCSLPDTTLSALRRRISCPGAILRSELSGKAATTPLSASIIAAVQVQEALKIIEGVDFRVMENTSGSSCNAIKDRISDEPQEGQSPAADFTSLCGKMFYYEGRHMSGRVVSFRAFDDDCPLHGQWIPSEGPELSSTTSVAEALDSIEGAFGLQAAILSRENCFVDFIYERENDRPHRIMLPSSKVEAVLMSDSALNRIPPEGYFQREFREFDRNFPYQSLTLFQTGFPPSDVIKVRIGDKVKNKLLYLELKN